MNSQDLILKSSGIVILLCIFTVGWLSNTIYADINDTNIEQPARFLSANGKDVPSPQDHVKQKQIHVYGDRIVSDLEEASWAEFTDTDSMDPFIDKGANSFEITPDSIADISVGDVISYKSVYADGLIIH